MITAFQLIFSPFETWEKITTSERGFLWTLGMHLLPLLAVSLAVEGYLLTQWGEKRGEFGFIIRVTPELAIRYSVCYFVLLLAAVIVSAKFLHLASQSFNSHTNYGQSFMVMAYGFGPIILARILDGMPQLNTWVCWALGAAGSVSVLYHGIGMVLKPDQTKGFGLYLITVLVIVVISALAHFAALAVLHGKILHPQAAQQQVSGLAAVFAAGCFALNPAQGG